MHKSVRTPIDKLSQKLDECFAQLERLRVADMYHYQDPFDRLQDLDDDLSDQPSP